MQTKKILLPGLEVPSVTVVMRVCARLGMSKFILCDYSRDDIYQKILLNVSPDDIHFATQKST